MRIALLHPTYWPEVRRGSERLIHDLGQALANRGHDVTLITTSPGPARVCVEDEMRVVRLRRPPQIPGLHFYEDHVANIPNLILRLMRGGFDLAHAFFPTDAWAALQARRLGGPRYIFSFHGIVNRTHLVRRRYRLEMFSQACAGAAATSVLSEAAARPFRRYLQCEPFILPGGVSTNAYRLGPSRARVPTLLCPATLEDPRKRGTLLLRAFTTLHERRPDTRLLLAGGRDPFARPDLASSLPDLARGSAQLPAGVASEEVSDPGGVIDLYHRAWVTALPSIDEAFGLVLLESLAAGTPVVAARSGACPEIVDSNAVGRLFEPDDESGLVAALTEALELCERPETAAACRARASTYDWSRIVEAYEEVYEAVLRTDERGDTSARLEA